MTCVAALVEKGVVWMGADSAGVDGNYGLRVRADPKVFENGPFLIGMSGSFRMGNLLRFKLCSPPHDPSIDDYQYMADSFVEAMRAAFHAGGFVGKYQGQEVIDGSFLVAYKGVLYEVQEDYQVAMMADNYAASGCGADLALGSLYSTKGQSPQKRIKTALEASERFNAGVRGPFVITSQKA